ncbi:MAG: uroporphyrinogen decarboxylase family protein [Bacteroidota bacterium]
MYEGLMNDVRTCVDLGIPKRVPVFALSEEFDVKWYGKYTYEETCQDGDKMAETWIAAIEHFGYDWAWLQIDDCFEFEPLGVGTKGEGNILRATKDYLPTTQEALKNLQIPDPKKDGRMPEKLRAISKVREHFGDTVCVVGGLAAPFSSVGLLYGLTESMTLMYSDPDLLRDTMDFFVELQKVWGKAQFEAGAHAVWLGDCNAMSNLISAEQYKEFAFEPCKQVVDEFNRVGGLTFLHNSEESVPHIELETDLGVSAINVGPGIDIGKAKKAVEGKTCLMGNLEPITTLMNSSPEFVGKEAERIMNVAKKGGGYLFNTGEMNPRGVPVANMEAMIKAAKANQ